MHHPTAPCVKDKTGQNEALSRANDFTTAISEKQPQHFAENSHRAHDPFYAPEKRIIAEHRPRLDNRPASKIIHWCLFLDSLARAAASYCRSSHTRASLRSIIHMLQACRAESPAATASTDAAVAMQPRTTRTHDAQRDASRRAAAARVQTWASMTTEYQDRFLPPCCHKAVITTTTQRNRYHPLKGTSNDISTYRSVYVTHRQVKQPKAALPSVPAKAHQTCSSAPHHSEAAGYTSVYRKDFQAWNANRHRSCRMSESHKDAAQTGLDSGAAASKEERPPVEHVTSYRSDFVAHPLPPRADRKPVYQTTNVLRSDPELAGHTDPGPSDGANELFEHFHNCSLQSKFHSQGGEAEPTFLSTTHAHYTAHQCQRARPVLPPMRPTGRSKEPLQTTTTMREDYRAWDTARRVPVRAQEMERRQNHRWVCGPTPELNPDSRPSSLRSKTSKTAVCDAAAPLRPAGKQTLSAFHPVSSRNEESRMCWSSSLDRGGTRPEGGQP